MMAHNFKKAGFTKQQFLLPLLMMTLFGIMACSGGIGEPGSGSAEQRTVALGPVATPAHTPAPSATPTPNISPTPISSPTPNPNPSITPTPTPAGERVRLTPGTGFSGATATPAAVGTAGMRGFDAKAIARWDVVPLQTLSGDFNIGVVAFHMNGIDRVEFSVNGGPWGAVREMTLNPQTQVWEYWAVVSAGDLADGRFEVRAVAYPKNAGEPNVLQDASGADLGEKSLYLYANARGTLPNTGMAIYISPSGSNSVGDGSAARPYQSIEKAVTEIISRSGVLDGATVYFLPGTYRIPDLAPTYPGVSGAFERWITFAGAPGTTRAQVILTSPGAGSTLQKVHVRDMRLQQTTDSTVLSVRSDPYYNHFWIDQCDVFGLGHYIPPGTSAMRSVSPVVAGTAATPVFWTDVTIEQTAATGLTTDTLIIRHVHATNIGGDFINSRKLIVDASVHHLRSNIDLGVHPDVVQVPIGATHNMIIYGLRATDVEAQGITLGDANFPLTNVAIVNASIQKIDTDVEVNWLAGGSTSNHVLYWNSTFASYNTHAMLGVRRNLDIRNCVFTIWSMASGIDVSGWTMDNNHFIDTTSYGATVFGTHPTTGDAGFVDYASGDLRPTASSVLRSRVNSVYAPIDAWGQERVAPGAIGAFESSP